MARRVFITVAEVSGDKHAAQLIRALRQLEPNLIVEGLGGPEMAAAGAIVHRDTVTRAAMGWRGILRAGEVYRALHWVRKHFETNRPDLQIGVDSPSMNFHFAKVAKSLGIPVLQYVAPQLWAWAPWRMKRLRRLVDQVACILPFEEDYFRAHGVNATFVGHPLFDELPPSNPASGNGHFPARPPVIGLLAGSRRSEATHNFPHLIEVANQIKREFPEASFVVPTTAGTHPEVERVLNDANAKNPRLRVEVGLDRFDAMVSRCDLCLTVSGTATLHVAALDVPMVVVYRINPVLWNLAARWLVPARTFALVNVLAAGSARAAPSEHVVPEFVPWYGSNQPVANVAVNLLRDPARLRAQKDRLTAVVKKLSEPGASLRTARLALAMIDRDSS